MHYDLICEFCETLDWFTKLLYNNCNKMNGGK